MELIRLKAPDSKGIVTANNAQGTNETGGIIDVQHSSAEAIKKIEGTPCTWPLTLFIVAFLR